MATSISQLYKNRSSPPEVFLGKGVLKICSKFTGEHPCRSMISCKFARYFQNTFSQEHLQGAATVKRSLMYEIYLSMPLSNV